MLHQSGHLHPFPVALPFDVYFQNLLNQRAESKGQVPDQPRRWVVPLLVARLFGYCSQEKEDLETAVDFIAEGCVKRPIKPT